MNIMHQFTETTVLLRLYQVCHLIWYSSILIIIDIRDQGYIAISSEIGFMYGIFLRCIKLHVILKKQHFYV